MGEAIFQLVEMPDGSRFATIARAQERAGRDASGVRARFALVLGVEAGLAGQVTAARGHPLTEAATPIGPGCRQCSRPACPQRSLPMNGRVLTVNERDRPINTLIFAQD